MRPLRPMSLNGKDDHPDEGWAMCFRIMLMPGFHPQNDSSSKSACAQKISFPTE